MLPRICRPNPQTKGGEDMQEEDLSRYLWKGLDLERYSVFKIIPQDEDNAAIIMYCNDKDNPHWCVEYLGSGHYFSTFGELVNYYNSRFKVPINQHL